MNPKFRALYLIFGTIGLALLIFEVVLGLPNIDPVMVLAIAVPDMLFFYLAYKTYPDEVADNKMNEYQPVKVFSGK